jgi:hypothetical protein
MGKRSREPSGKSEEDKQDSAEPNDVESDQQRQRNCVEGTRRRWYGEDERTGRDEWCSEHRQHRLRIRERADRDSLHEMGIIAAVSRARCRKT